MLVSHARKFIFLKTKKTAGTSVEIFFERYCRPAHMAGTEEHGCPEQIYSEGIVGRRSADVIGARWYNHMPAAAVREQIGDEIWASYFKFCTVRNPFDRLVSEWWHFVPKNRTDTFPDIKHQFCEWIESVSEIPSSRAIYCIDGAICVDEVIRHERLTDDILAVSRRLGIADDPARLGSYKGDIRKRPEHYRLYYTPTARARVEVGCRDELEAFSYEF